MVFSFKPSLSFKSAARDADRDALARLGNSVRARLNADPAAYRLPVEGIEIWTVSDFLTGAECRRLMTMIDSVARPSPTYHGNPDGGRTSYSGDVDPHDAFIRTIQRRIDDLLGIASEFGETLQGQRYAAGQEFKHHADYFDTAQPYWADELRRGGQRSWTAMGYLNTVEAGGTTDFPKVGMAVPPHAGVLLVWNNMAADGRPNPRTLHAGTPVVQGVKYVVTRWYRARRWS